MRKLIFILLLIFVSGFVFCQEIKIQKLFLIPSGNNVGQIGPEIQLYKDAILSGKGNPDTAWGVYGFGITSNNNLMLLDNFNQKTLIYSINGELVEELSGIGGSQNSGDPFGNMTEFGNYIIIDNLFSFSVFDIQSRELKRYQNIRRFGEPYRRATFYRIIDKTAYYWDRRLFWYVADISDPRSGPIKIEPEGEIISNLGISLNDGVYYLPGGEMLFKDFEFYQPIYIPNDINKGIAAKYIGTWENINIWIQGSTNAIIGPIGNSTHRIGLVGESYSKNPTNIHFVLSSEGYIYFTYFSIDEGGTVVNRLDLRPFFEEKQKLNDTN